ncbi:MAG: hypothetical protein JW947_09585 [Sedimentisphaerales bacterium]|nr:hypothetical protein [Sedimentisphaerales bacterium]
MNYQERWQIIAEYDGGGQGKVYRVCRKKEYIEVQEGIRGALRRFASHVTYGEKQDSENHQELRKWLPKCQRMVI